MYEYTEYVYVILGVYGCMCMCDIAYENVYRLAVVVVYQYSVWV